MGSCLSLPIPSSARTRRTRAPLHAAHTPTPVPRRLYRTPTPVPWVLDADKLSSWRPDPVLDVLFLPHVLDAIVASASHSTRLALRATCTEVRAAVDRVLFAHVAIGSTTTTAAAAADDDAIPRDNDDPAPVLRSPDGHTLPFIIPGPPPVPRPVLRTYTAEDGRKLLEKRRLKLEVSHGLRPSSDIDDTDDASEASDPPLFQPDVPPPAALQLAKNTRCVDVCETTPVLFDFVKRHAYVDVVRVLDPDLGKRSPVMHVDFAKTLVYVEDSEISNVTFGTGMERVVHFVRDGEGRRCFSSLAIRQPCPFGTGDVWTRLSDGRGGNAPFYTVPNRARIEEPAAREEVFVFGSVPTRYRMNWFRLTAEVTERILLRSRCTLAAVEEVSKWWSPRKILDAVASQLVTRTAIMGRGAGAGITPQLSAELVEAWGDVSDARRLGGDVERVGEGHAGRAECRESHVGWVSLIAVPWTGGLPHKLGVGSRDVAGRPARWLTRLEVSCSCHDMSIRMNVVPWSPQLSLSLPRPQPNVGKTRNPWVTRVQNGKRGGGPGVAQGGG